MLYSLYVNQEMARVEKISINAAVVFETMKQLMVLPYIKTVNIAETRYTVLYHNMILLQIPLFFTSKRTLSRSIAELKEAKLIISNDNNMMPAYAMTQKGITYFSASSKSDIQKIATEENKIRKKPLFELNKQTKISDLKSDYFKLLKIHSCKMCSEQNIPVEEFDKFIDWHSSKGNKFTNYIRAFGTWCRNYKKYNSNNTEKSKNPFDNLLG